MRLIIGWVALALLAIVFTSAVFTLFARAFGRRRAATAIAVVYSATGIVVCWAFVIAWGFTS